MTVKELIAELKGYRPESKIILSSGTDAPNWDILSIYDNSDSDNAGDIVWIDIEQHGKRESRASIKKRLGPVIDVSKERPADIAAVLKRLAAKFRERHSKKEIKEEAQWTQTNCPDVVE